MRPQYRLRSLFALVLAAGIAIGLLRGVIFEPEPQWGFYLISFVAVCASIVAIFITMFDQQLK